MCGYKVERKIAISKALPHILQRCGLSHLQSKLDATFA